MGLKFVLVFLLSFLIAFLITPMMRKVALRLKVVDRPNHRKIHRRVITRVGGLAIYLGFNIAIIVAFFVDRGVFSGYIHQLLGLAIGGTIIVGVGLFDDIRGTNAKVKFFWQIVAAIVVICFGYVIRRVTNPFGGQIYLGFFLGNLMTIVWIVGITNALNLIDGLDGLAAGVGGIACITLFFVGLSQHNWLVAYLALALAGSIVGFLKFNFIPAKVFMGDTGSMFLGFIFACITIVSSQKSTAAVALIVPIVALGVPIFDTLFAILRRLIGGTYPFDGDQEHIHHKLLKTGLTHKRTVLALYVASLIFGISAYVMIFLNNRDIGIVLAIMMVVVFVAVRKLGLLRYSYKEVPPTKKEKCGWREFAVGEAGVRRKWFIPRRAALVAIPILLVGLAGWNNSFDKLAHVIDCPERYEGREVTAVGRTTGAVSIPFLGSIYRLSDGTGTIWVVSKEDYTPNNRFFCVAGRVDSEVDIKSDLLNKKYIKRLLEGVRLKDVRLGPVLMEKERGSVTSSFYFLKRRLRKE